MSDNDFDILDWIETGTVGRREVTIYNDPALAAEMDRLQAEYEKAKRFASEDEASMADVSRLAELEAEMEAVLARWEASKAVWTVQALALDVVRDLLEEFPDPKPPVKPREPKESPNPAKTAERRKEYEAEVAEYEKLQKPWLAELDKVRLERELRLISAAVVDVTTPKGSTSHVPVEVLRAMRAKPHGEARIKALSAAVNELTTGEVEIPAPHRG